jgi:phenylalanyl-tRNA synthetase beta chain
LALGQPMHAFDLDALQGGICVRAARQGETLRLLDDTTLELDEQSVVIADHAVPIALAGIMGGAATGVHKATSRIFLESAYFDPIRIAGTARNAKLHTDAAHRFERGVDPTGQERAVEFATKLLMDLCGGNPGPTVLTESSARVPRPKTIAFRLTRANALLGMAFSESEARDIFKRLNLSVVEDGATWQVTPPTYRFDLTQEVDLVEELARLRGYTAIPATLPNVERHLARSPHGALNTPLLREQLVSAGYFEAVTYSFVAQTHWRLFSGPLKELGLANPISREMGVMRSSLWPGLLAALAHNQNRQVSSLRMFEIGMVFQQTDQELQQLNRIAGIAVGNVAPEQWGMAARKIDFFDVKQDVLNLLSASGLTDLSFEPALVDGLHPGECAAIRHRNQLIGSLGSIHPKILNSLNILGNPIVFELAVEALSNVGPATYKPFSKFPSVRRDIALIVPETIMSGVVVECVLRAGGVLLKDLQLFDVYRGQGIDSDKKSLALGLIFQAPSSTLTDSQVQAAVSEIVDLLGRELGATLRV